MSKLSFMELRKIHGRFVEKKKEISRNKIIKKSQRILAQLKDCHKGERCFIIGNGPSLRVEDLEKLKKEICFSSHRIYKIFSHTNWRPTYYCAQDVRLIRKSFAEINRIEAKLKFIGYCVNDEFELLKDYVFIKLILDEFYPDYPQFSDNPLTGIFEGYTVTYMCIQIAGYMGFREIVLLGIDHNYSVELLPDGSKKINEAVKDHFDVNDTIENLPQPAKSTLAYKSALNFCKKHGISIYNATRGGNLDVFERVDFDSLLNVTL